MPIYEYKCNDCGAAFEKLVLRPDAKVVCEKCSGSSIERQLSVFAPKTATPGCARESSCPAAGSHVCGGGCGCGGH